MSTVTPYKDQTSSKKEQVKNMFDAISTGMLALGTQKINKLGLQSKIELKLADSESLPFSDNSFDAITAGFGVRNFENLEKGIQHMVRVLKPGGTMVILEFSKPRIFPVKQLYTFYFRYVTPFVGKVFSQDNSAYRYLPESVNAFPDGERFLTVLRNAGLKQPRAILLSFGIASIYIGKK